jgi:hypothetical protein
LEASPKFQNPMLAPSETASVIRKIRIVRTSLDYETGIHKVPAILTFRLPRFRASFILVKSGRE